MHCQRQNCAKESYLINVLEIKKIIGSTKQRKRVVVSVVLCMYNNNKTCQYSTIEYLFQSMRWFGNQNITVTLDG